MASSCLGKMHTDLLVTGYLNHHFGEDMRSRDVIPLIFGYTFEAEIWNIQLLNESYLESKAPFKTIRRIRPLNNNWNNAFGEITISKAMTKGSKNEYIWKTDESDSKVTPKCAEWHPNDREVTPK